MAFVITRTEYLEINDYLGTTSIPLATPAWRIINMSTLFEGPDVRGSNRVLPGTAGEKAFPKRVGATVKVLQMVVYGGRKWDNTVYSDRHVGLETNLLYLADNLAVPPAAPAGTRASTLHLADGSTRTANIQVIKFRIGSGGGLDTLATLDINIPTGRYA